MNSREFCCDFYTRQVIVMFHEQINHAQAATNMLVYDDECSCLMLYGQKLSSGDNIEVQVFGSWVPGLVAVDAAGWYLLTIDQVSVRLHAGLSARSSEFRFSYQTIAQSLPQNSSPRILIVDDDDALLQGLTQTISLRIPASQIHTASSSDEALTHLQAQQYDAIVSDIKMPGMDGFALLAKVQELQLDSPTLLITGHGDYDLAVDALRGGAYDYIQKPFECDSFIAALVRAVHACQLRRQAKEQQNSLALYAYSLERLLLQRSQELAEAHTTKDKVISLVSQKLNEPIAHLKSITHLLRQKLESVGLSEIVTQSFIDIELSLSRTEELAQELLNTSNIETHRFILHRRLNNLVALCQAAFEEELVKVSIELTSQHLLDSSVDVEVDGDQIRQVLAMLISNVYALATREEPVTITLQQTGYEAIITVRDQGTNASLGVGFYVSRKIIESHGGSLKVQHFPGKRRTLFLTLPIYYSSTPTAEDGTFPLPRTFTIWTLTPKEVTL
jgi:FixJ family two-component response regulator